MATNSKSKFCSQNEYEEESNSIETQNSSQNESCDNESFDSQKKQTPKKAVTKAKQVSEQESENSEDDDDEKVESSKQLEMVKEVSSGLKSKDPAVAVGASLHKLTIGSNKEAMETTIEKPKSLKSDQALKTSDPKSSKGANRIWNEADEIKVLEWFLKCKKEGVSLSSDMNGFGDFLGKVFNAKQLTGKFNKMKLKYFAKVGTSWDEGMFKNQNEKILFELSRKVWGEKGESSGKSEMFKDLYKSGKRKRVDLVERPSNKRGKQSEVKKGKKNAMEIEEDFWAKYPLLEKSLIIHNSGYLNDASLILDHAAKLGHEWADHLEKKWEVYQRKEQELILTKTELLILHKLTHVYTAILEPNNDARILVDGEEKKKANFLSGEDFEPALIPSKTTPDPDDEKPEDWDEREKIPDPEAVKPEEWDEEAPLEILDEEAEKPDGWLDDEPEMIDDPEATKPEDWDDEEDGEFEAPKIENPKCEAAPGCGEWKRPMKNPAYKGKWRAPMIDNPAYKGIWEPQEIPNPSYFELDRPNFEPIAASALRSGPCKMVFCLTTSLIAGDEKTAESYRTNAWKPKFKVEKEKLKAEEAPSAVSDGLKGVQKTVFDILYKIADIPFLSRQRSQIFDLIEKAEKQPNLTIGATVSVIVVILTLFIKLLFGGK